MKSRVRAVVITVSLAVASPSIAWSQGTGFPMPGTNTAHMLQSLIEQKRQQERSREHMRTREQGMQERGHNMPEHNEHEEDKGNEQ